MSRLDELIAELCPDGVEYKKIKEVYTRIKGTPITASKMKEIEDPDGEIRIFAGGKTVINAREHNIPNANITRVPAVLVQSRGVIDAVYYDKPFTFKNEMWAYTNENQVSVKYLYYVLKNNVEYFRAAASGMGSLPQISLPVTEDFLVPVPPLPVQQEIIRILDHFTELTAELQKQLDVELTARKKQYEYYLSREFTVLNAPIHKIGEITNVFSAARVHKNEWKTEGVPFFRSSDVISSFGGVENSRGKAFISFELYEKLSAKSGKVKKGDMLITGGGTIGIPYLVPNDEPLYMKDADLLCIQKNDSVLSEFLYFYFLTPQFRDYLANITHDATIPHYTIEQIKKTPIPVPSRNEQEKIVNTISRFFDLCNDLTSGLPAEIAARQKQYEYYRDKLLTFPEKG